jgi:hypothetical protein
MGEREESDGEERNRRSSFFRIIASYHPLNFSSTGKTPATAPHSVVMLAMVNRSSIEMCSMPEPVNSIAAFRTSSLLKRPARATMTSLPVTPGESRPSRLTEMTRGICHQNLPVAQIPLPCQLHIHLACLDTHAASVLTIAVPKHPTPP